VEVLASDKTGTLTLNQCGLLHTCQSNPGSCLPPASTHTAEALSTRHLVPILLPSRPAVPCTTIFQANLDAGHAG
jgi:hypothetical protein